LLVDTFTQDYLLPAAILAIGEVYAPTKQHQTRLADSLT